MVGNGGRECAFAKKLSEDTTLYAVMSHRNPSIIECVEASGGSYTIDNPADPAVVANFALRNVIDYAFVNTDEPLANGVVDALLDVNIKAVGGTREATRIEWDKVYSMELVNRICPEFAPLFRIARSASQIDSLISEFASMGMEIVVKPQGLTGGKGVKVMPEHLHTYDDCKTYAAELLQKNPDHGVLFVEKLEGIEFTIMGITDGTTLVLSPASYDYPFRKEDDRGPGTGGMGCFTNSKQTLPFMTDDDLADCRSMMQKIITSMKNQGILFKGVLNGGFFKTKNGIKFMEFNGRFGDPEGINILSMLDGSFSKVIMSLWNETLSESDVKFHKKACVVKYLVGHEYPEPSPNSTIFEMDEKAIADLGVSIFPASCVKIGNKRYETLKKSRVVAFAAASDDIEGASSIVNAAIDLHVSGDLEYRRDIGSKKSLEKLERAAATMQ